MKRVARISLDTMLVIAFCVALYSLILTTCKKPEPKETFRGNWNVPAQTEEERLRELELEYQQILETLADAKEK